MMDFFAALFEWGGLIPLYSVDLGNHLRGWDMTCTDFVGTPWYIYTGCLMLGVTLFAFALQYIIIDRTKYGPTFNKAKHWWLMALVLMIVNFTIGFTLPYNDLTGMNMCKDLKINMSDCIGFGVSNAIWSLIFFMIITITPLRKLVSYQCRNTTFWKP